MHCSRARTCSAKTAPVEKEGARKRRASAIFDFDKSLAEQQTQPSEGKRREERANDPRDRNVSYPFVLSNTWAKTHMTHLVDSYLEHTWAGLLERADQIESRQSTTKALNVQSPSVILAHKGRYEWMKNRVKKGHPGCVHKACRRHKCICKR